MIVCRSCGGHNADTDDFCGSCGEFLEWTGEKLAPKSAQPAVAEPASDIGPADTEPPQGAVQALVAPPLPTAPDPSRPMSEPEPGPVARRPAPQEMHPQAPVRKRPTKPTAPSPPTRQLQPDDLICGRCGEGNPPIRRFCSRCGESLQTATVVPTPWWRKVRKLFERRVHPAGTRPRRRIRLLTLRGMSAALRRVLIVTVLLSGLCYAVFPSLRGAVNETARAGINWIEQSIGRQPVAVRPIRVSAVGELPDHLAPSAVDGFSNTFWVAPDAAARPTLVVEFERPARLVLAIVHNGGGEDFQALGRPRELHMVYFVGDRIVGASDALLTDVPGQQRIELGGDSVTDEGVTRVDIQVVSFYSSPQSSAMALSEIEFFERR